MNRAEHLQWCKDRALEYVNKGDLVQAFTSMSSDLGKHDETKEHPAISLGMGLIIIDELNTRDKMREFINGFY